MKSVPFFAFLMLTLCVGTVSHADTTKTLAEKVLEKYQSFETYHARWEPVIDDPNHTSSTIWETAFDRKSKNVLFRISGSQTDKKRHDQLLLLVVDGSNMHCAMSLGNDIQKTSKLISDPNQLTYRDVRRSIPHLYPFDLPLVFSEYSFMEVIQGAVKETITLTKETDFYPGFEIFPQHEGDTSAQYQIEPKTGLLKAFRFMYRGRSPSPVFRCEYVQVNKELPPDLFDFEKQLESYEKQAKNGKEK